MENTKQTKQIVGYTVINYVGIAIGIVSTLFIYPLDVELLGIFRYIDSWAQMLFPIITLGSAQALIHFYPQLPEKMQVRLFGFSLVSIFKLAFWVSLLVLFFYFFVDDINTNYIFYSLPIALVLALVELFKRQATTLEKIAVPTLYEKVVPKLALPIAFLLVLWGYVSVNMGFVLYVLAFVFLLAGVALYVKKHYKYKICWSEAELFTHISKKEYYRYSLYAFAGSFGSFFAFRIDSIMIPNFIDLEANGIYNIGVTLASTLAIPATGIFALQAPVISKLIKTNNWQALHVKYKETAKLLLFVAALFYGSVLLGMEPLFNLLPTQNKLLPALPIIYILGASMFVNMSTGFNSEIISYSKHYRFNLITILFLVVLNVGLNYYVLKYTHWGILGVACASLLAMTVFNFLKTAFIYKVFKLLPFDAGYFKITSIFLIGFGLAYLLPTSTWPAINLLLKCSFFVIFCIFFVYKLRLILVLNQFVGKKIKNF
ncbi:polysaccharide biosynthesis C-terminal domain-containing protein [Flavobacterium agricola]|uniref:Polysaccharide biosynthesis C-terminal domain-containing protein n=1 Tax=Flavobacterium agricola TaxID=2870839 RepID=A0ABY6M2H2_9FLAO|nr:polysaccharide biosynthesis C-terminal domain-containing protein [Flavobacterium agricola]UYW01483.1 polysaccharide biosynthesis C-terminal domain-containing protein [Flavobacterium agricola]